MRLLFTVLLFSSSLLFMVAQEEKIYSFHSDITIDASGMIEVREQIRLYAKGDQFKRGITRSLPLRRTDSRNQRHLMDYTVKSVLVDGAPASFFTGKEGSDLVIYVGDKDVFLEPGYYTYVITYETAGQVGFFEGYDELSWNANGLVDNMIDSVSAVVTLPAGAEVLSSRCYTGEPGSTESNCFSETMEDGALLTTAVNLPAGEMLTVSVGFTKGVVTPPAGVAPGIATWFDKNGLALLGGFFTLLLLAYYRVTWRRYGVDPPTPVAIPQFSPPDGLSPAAVGMLHKGRFMDDLVTASIVNLSVKGYVNIEEKIEKKGLFRVREDKTFVLTKLNDDYTVLPDEEAVVMRQLFSSRESILLDGKYNSSVSKMTRAYHASMSRQYSHVLEEGRNYRFHVVPWLSFILYLFILRYFINNDLLQFQANKYGLFITVPLLLIAYIIYAIQIVRPGERKLHFQSNIKGLKMYLDIAEEKQIQFFNPPSVTPEKFEELLPYAIALDMEEVWGEKFEKTLLSSALEPEVYQPGWYIGSRVNAARFAHVLNSTLSNTLSHAATSPSSSGGKSWSSGSFGGGSSGMGGGGGRAGGW